MTTATSQTSTSSICPTRVVKALHDFGDDWDDKRESLAKHLDSVGALAAESADTFSEADRRLADEALENLSTT